MNNNWQKFSTDATELLFSAVDEDDVVDADYTLPEHIDLFCPQETMQKNYALCLQFWEDGFTRRELLGLVNQYLRNSDQPHAVRMRYKYIRARYKHLRFAQRLYGRHHECGRIFNTTTVLLGHFQDAFRNGHRQKLHFYGNLLRVFLSRPVWSRVHYSLHHIEIDSEQGFVDYRRDQIQKLQQLVANPQLTGKEFHDLRKIVSQQVSFYDTLRSLEPDNGEARKISRFMAAINGLMGDRHDVMVAEKLSDAASYDRPAPLDQDIRYRLEQLLAIFPV